MTYQSRHHPYPSSSYEHLRGTRLHPVSLSIPRKARWHLTAVTGVARTPLSSCDIDGLEDRKRGRVDQEVGAGAEFSIFRMTRYVMWFVTRQKREICLSLTRRRTRATLDRGKKMDDHEWPDPG